MRLLYGQNEAVAEFVASLIPHCARGFDACRAIGVIDDEGRLIGGVVFTEWNPEAGTIEITAAATTPRWVSRELIARVGEYVFHGARCQALVARTPASNTRLIRLWRRLGATEHTVPRLFGPDEDAVFSIVTRESWAESPFNPRKSNGQVESTRAA